MFSEISVVRNECISSWEWSPGHGGRGGDTHFLHKPFCFAFENFMGGNLRGLSRGRKGREILIS